ncbi:hypothetical protein C0J45_0141 [Silurus meridionalis]|nr:hypothetical protein C0J45_0141 [Silurus meridionalis]
MDKLKKVLSGQDGNDDLNVLQSVDDATTLNWGTRVKAFIGCFVLGVTFSILGSCLLWVPKRGLILFAVFYTFGNVASLLSSFLFASYGDFLHPPDYEHIPNSDDDDILDLGNELTPCALCRSPPQWHNKGLVVLFCILQFLALTCFFLFLNDLLNSVKAVKAVLPPPLIQMGPESKVPLIRGSHSMPDLASALLHPEHPLLVPTRAPTLLPGTHTHIAVFSPRLCITHEAPFNETFRVREVGNPVNLRATAAGSDFQPPPPPHPPPPTPGTSSAFRLSGSQVRLKTRGAVTMRTKTPRVNQ